MKVSEDYDSATFQRKPGTRHIITLGTSGVPVSRLVLMVVLEQMELVSEKEDEEIVVEVMLILVVLILDEEVVLIEVVMMLLVSLLLPSCEIFIIKCMQISSYKVLTSTAITSCFGWRVIVAVPSLGYSISLYCKSGFKTLLCLLLPNRCATHIRNEICCQNL